MDKYCPSCKLVLPPTAKRCTACGKIATLSPNTVVNSGADRYTIDSVLGIGGMGIVYRATDSFSLTAVVKQLHVDNPADLPDAQRRFKREAQVQAGLNSPFYPAGYGYFVDQNLEFMAMEFVAGRDLEKTLTTLGGKMSEDEVLRLGIQICDGLSVLHNHIDPATNTPEPHVHRDIKPANVILRPSGQICILDLGIARTLNQSAGTQVRATRAGTFEYASPQQVSGTDMSIRDDIYSLAATLFHLVTGAPFTGDFTQRAAEIDALPPTWRAAFRRAIHNDTNLRQRSVDEFKTDLIALLPPQLRPALPAPAGAPAPIPATGFLSIRWRVTLPYMTNPNEWVQSVAGQVIQGTVGMPGVNIVPIMTDTGAGAMAHNTRGASVNTGPHGDFGLNLPDVTIPVTVDRRQIIVIVEDPNSGQELYRETVELNRPGVARRIQARGGAGVRAAAHAAAAPFQAVGHAMAAGARGLGRGIAWPFQKLWQVGTALTGIKTVLAIAGLFMAATLVLARLQQSMPFVLYIWPHTWIAALASAFVAFRMRRRGGIFTAKVKQRSLGQALRSPVLIATVTMWAAATIGWVFGPH